MLVSKLRKSDRAELKQLLARQGFDYELPEFAEFCEVLGLWHDGKLCMAVAARPTVELFLIVDDTWQSPKWRMGALKRLHDAMERRLDALGFTDGHAWLPPPVAKAFGKRLMRTFGWRKQLWESFSRKVERKA